MDESNKRLKSNKKVVNESDDINQLLTLFDYENIDKIMSSSDDPTADNENNNKNVDREEEHDDISELTDSKDHGFEDFKYILMRNNETVINRLNSNNDHQTEAMSEDTKIDDVDTPVFITSPPISRQDKEKSLLLIPYLLRDFVNAGDMTSITNLINQNFTENCLFKTPALSKRKEGRKFIIEYFQSALRCIPDIIVTSGTPTVKFSTLAGRKFKLIITDMTSIGTMITRDASDYLWNDVSNRKENQAYLDQLKERMTSFFKRFVCYGINSSGFALHIHNELILQLTVNDEKFMIESFVVTRRNLKLKMIRPPHA